MSPASILRLPFSSASGWDELRRRQPSLIALVSFIVLPLSLVPPVMLYYAGTQYGEAFGAGFADKQWQFITTIFFLAELLTFAVMGWLIYEVGNTREARISVHDAYLLAAIAPIPLWLSALALLIPSLPVVAVIALATLGLSCSIVYQGIRGLCHVKEDVVAMSITYTVMAASVIAWGLLLAIVWAF
ncbi:Yip1 family protein [Aquisalimonas lutea]|uniref:Yip1 family protein n=1 Tax=Aquisalimonas lutea TaxID=1327750 RepID=UPI0025B37F69|nr:Yip1 family protein [Aquisalimonas lutea]MDN3519258.1 Yip1 family protein [Aquisalimonas lutea]